MNSTSCVEFARAYAACGFAPLAVSPNAKRPLKSGWQGAPVEMVVKDLGETKKANLGIALPDTLIALDIDNKNGKSGGESLEMLERAHGKLPTTLTQLTANGGEHRLFRVPPGCGIKNKVEFVPGLDIRAEGGLIVVEPSAIDARNYKWTDWDVLSGAQPAIADAPDWLIEKIQAVKPQARPATESEKRIEQGHRNDALFRKACALRRVGLDVQEIYPALKSLNMRACIPPLPEKEVEAIAKSAEKYSPSHDAEHSHRIEGYTLLTARALEALPRLEWIIKGILPRHGLAALYGPSGSGKSFLVLDMAMAISRGKPWFGSNVKSCPVVYCALEGEAGIAQRVAAYRNSIGEVDEQVRFVLQPFNLLQSQDVNALGEVVLEAGIGGGVTILDTLNRAAPGSDENDSKDMGRIIAAAKQLQQLVGGLVLLVHHTGKNVAQGLRGHSSLVAALDCAIEVTRTGDRRLWNVAKSKDGEDGSLHPFELEVVQLGIDNEGEPLTSCVIAPDSNDIGAMKIVRTPKGGNQRIVWKAVREMLRTAMPSELEIWPIAVPAGRSHVRLEDAVVSAKYRLTCESDQRARSTRLALTGLVNGGLFQLKDGWIYEP